MTTNRNSDLPEKNLEESSNNGSEIISNDDIEIELSKYKIKNYKSYFKLNPYRVAVLSMILAMNYLLSWISYAALTPLSIIGFLRVELNFLSYLICWKMINGFYALLLVTPGTWIRYLGMNPEPVGSTVMNISDMSVLGVFILISFLLNTKAHIKGKKSFYIKYCSSAFITIVFAGLINIAYNFTFILDWYASYTGFNGYVEYKNLWYAGILMGFNVLKYTVNFLLFISIYDVVKYISKNTSLN
ncbi:hypothetical protein SHELI_v1c02520 [Spiroplasma helicoides]|uniref:Riboflavin transporter n=1 Tax=Spiroplasma helicoides TaxID=216938 RepID=A0A1B3SJW2_9MOLU|nr:hypothetical protein [Spiroplasma helicoides]AOG60207.1 hypothetical protein SHELI_v1c02520 [Spiroplasma helicoides]